MRRSRPNPAVVSWLADTLNHGLFLAAVTLGELQAGAEALRAQDPARADAIETWIDTVATAYNVLPINAPVFRRRAQLMHHRPRDLFEDAMIAATALVHNLTVVTRNLRDFERLRVPAFNPFR